MNASLIMVIRHGEKPDLDSGIRGVDPTGQEDPDSLSVRGWQRAGALIAWFGASQGASPRPGISRPAFLFAPAPTPQAPSMRAAQTLAPLGACLGLPVATPFSKGEEPALALALRSLPGPALVAWEHKMIPALARELTGGGAATPPVWPDERFDMVWVFEGDAQRGLRFGQVPQLLLDGDSAAPL